MQPIHPHPNLTEQVYRAILDEICDGALAPGAHLVQEQLAAQLGVSRQPVQQAMALLKADGMVEDAGKRGLRVTALDLRRMRQHYDVRAALDGLAARRAAERVAATAAVAEDLERRGRATLDAGNAAVAQGAVPDQIRHDEAFHTLLYEASGNPLLARTAAWHWRFLRRAMGDVLRHAEPPRTIWRQHAGILDAVLAGDPQRAEDRAVEHIRVAADMLADALAGPPDRDDRREPAADPT